MRCIETALLACLHVDGKNGNMNLAAFFDEVDRDKCGGKGRNLVALHEKGFPVPQGFIVTVDAYSQFKSKTEMPEAAVRAITDCYERLVAASGNERVAVRSSASTEDSAVASFAGQYDSSLGIEGVQAVLQHIVECWRSLYSARSILYRQRMKLPEEDLEMAVVVQTMLAPRSAGVVFTANPYTMDKNVMIVESSWGCGENVVSGTVTPDYFEILKNDRFDIVKSMPGSKETVDFSKTDLPEEGSGSKPRPIYSIAEEPLKKLCGVAREIEHAFGGPQDIEWAIEDDCSISILQSRPLTRFRDQ
jgi:pyruvate,water dikinase